MLVTEANVFTNDSDASKVIVNALLVSNCRENAVKVSSKMNMVKVKKETSIEEEKQNIKDIKDKYESKLSSFHEYNKNKKVGYDNQEDRDRQIRDDFVKVRTKDLRDLKHMIAGLESDLEKQEKELIKVKEDFAKANDNLTKSGASFEIKDHETDYCHIDFRMPEEKNSECFFETLNNARRKSSAMIKKHISGSQSRAHGKSNVSSNIFSQIEDLGVLDFNDFLNLKTAYRKKTNGSFEDKRIETPVTFTGDSKNNKDISLFNNKSDSIDNIPKESSHLNKSEIKQRIDNIHKLVYSSLPSGDSNARNELSNEITKHLLVACGAAKWSENVLGGSDFKKIHITGNSKEIDTVIARSQNILKAHNKSSNTRLTKDPIWKDIDEHVNEFRDHAAGSGGNIFEALDHIEADRDSILSLKESYNTNMNIIVASHRNERDEKHQATMNNENVKNEKGVSTTRTEESSFSRMHMNKSKNENMKKMMKKRAVIRKKKEDRSKLESKSQQTSEPEQNHSNLKSILSRKNKSAMANKKDIHPRFSDEVKVRDENDNDNVTTTCVDDSSYKMSKINKSKDYDEVKPAPEKPERLHIHKTDKKTIITIQDLKDNKICNHLIKEINEKKDNIYRLIEGNYNYGNSEEVNYAVQLLIDTEESFSRIKDGMDLNKDNEAMQTELQELNINYKIVYDFLYKGKLDDDNKKI